MAERTLFYLHDLPDYQVASGYPDVRGWEVKDSEDRTVGTVENLLVNKKTERVVYLDVEVNKQVIQEGHEPYEKTVREVHEFVNKEGEDHLIIPIGLAELDEKNKKVLCAVINHETFRSAKRIERGSTIAPEYEIQLYHHYLPAQKTDQPLGIDEEFYERKAFQRK